VRRAACSMAWRTAEAGLSCRAAAGGWFRFCARPAHAREVGAAVGPAGTIWKRLQLVASLCRILPIPSVAASRKRHRIDYLEKRRPMMIGASTSNRACSLIRWTLVV
jgi:hypothetical protein